MYSFDETGRGSVPLPASNDAKLWAAYRALADHAERQETVEQCQYRHRRNCNDCGLAATFDRVNQELLKLYEQARANDEEPFEYAVFGSHEMRKLSHAFSRMEEAGGLPDRDDYQKAAAGFAEVATMLAWQLGLLQEGGASE